MLFLMNDREWRIIELSQEEIRQKIKDYDGTIEEAGQYFGTTHPKYQNIYIDKDLHIQQKRQTLLHELMHCYLVSYLFDMNNLTEENLCDISACSHDIIHNIVNDYFIK